MPTIPQRIASAFAVFCGRYGDVAKMAEDREQSRQSLYREAEQVANAVDGAVAATANCKTTVSTDGRNLAVVYGALPTDASAPFAVLTGARSPENHPAQSRSGLQMYLPSLSTKPKRLPRVTSARPYRNGPFPANWGVITTEPFVLM